MRTAKNKYVYLVLCLVIMFFGKLYVLSNNKTKLYNLVKDTKYVMFFKIDFDGVSQKLINNDDLNVFIAEMKNISNIIEYSANAALSGEFKKGFRIFQIGTKEKDQLPLLYSIEDQSMIIRKMDVIPNFKNKEPNVVVYQFQISNKLVSLLKKYENLLPETGDYFTSWPLDTY